MTIPLTGYADRLSVRPGETISFHVSHQISNDNNESSIRNHQVQTSLVRVICADAAAGIQTEPVNHHHAATFKCLQEPRPCHTQLGSHAEISLPLDVTASLCTKGWTFVGTIYPTRLQSQKQRQSIASVFSVFDCFLDSQGRLCASFLNDVIICCKKSMPPNHWVKICFALDVASQQATLAWSLVDYQDQGVVNLPGDFQTTKFNDNTKFEHPLDDTTSLLLLAAALVEKFGKETTSSYTKKIAHQHFNGRIEHPQLWTSCVIHSVGDGRSQDDIFSHLVSSSCAAPDAAWNFSLAMTTQQIRDTSKLNLHGRLINAPTRAVRGSNWTGREMCWRHAPSEYAAIHFHETDFSRCHDNHATTTTNRNWPVCYQWEIPEDLKSGNYALLLKTPSTDDNHDEQRQYDDNIPFFVVPPKGQIQANLAVVVSTFTYIIYGNHARSEWLNDPHWEFAWKEQSKNNKLYRTYNPREHPEYGWSTYNDHADGSGVCLASWHRPLLNLRIGYVTFPYPDKYGSGLRHYPADSHLTAWLEDQGIEYDIITDWELHTEGSQVLAPYRAVTTGTHPEYHTDESWKALLGYRNNGGRLMYLGGNGFYWKIAVNLQDHLMEIRRGEGGIRAWASEPGEYYHQLDGQYGGLWRRNGRAPQALVGVGFTAQGNFIGSYYRIHEKARSDPRTAWMLEGIATDTFGDHGLSGHGAAGFELDRIDLALGTPEHAIVVASSEGHNPDAPWVLVFEERLTHLGNLAGVPDHDLIRSDVTFFETPRGGAVFSTGSITYCGSLLTNQCNNDVSTLTRNVLYKFLDPDVVFQVPAA